MDEYPRLRFPRPDRIPSALNLRKVPRIDTGAAFRPDWRTQDPSADPKEPYGGEASATGNDHGWSNCTMASAALCYAYHVQDKSGPYGGDMRHKQGDMSGGTDLYDARDAWKNYGNQTLTIKIGAGWNAVKTAHSEGRAIIIQGEGNVPGSESFDGGHACAIGPETSSDGKWLFGDPLASGWQWVTPDSIRTWAERISSGIYFAVSKIPSSGGSGDMAISLHGDKTLWHARSVVEVPAGGAWFLDAARTQKGANFGPTTAEYVGWSAEGSRAVIVATGIPWNGDVKDTIVYVSSSYEVTDLPSEPDSDIEARDAEWIAWLLEGAPGT